MMNPNKDKIASLILASRPPDGGPESVTQGPEVENDSSVGLDAAGQKILNAIETKDLNMLVGGLMDFLTLADTNEESEGADTASGEPSAGGQGV